MKKTKSKICNEIVENAIDLIKWKIEETSIILDLFNKKENKEDTKRALKQQIKDLSLAVELLEKHPIQY